MDTKKRSSIIIAVLVAAVLAGSYAGGLFSIWQDKLTDLLFTRSKPRSEIVIVAIDEPSLQSIGQWPWPRTVFGRALNALNSAAVIGIDVNFKEPSGHGPADDDYLASTLQNSLPKTVLSSELQSDGRSISPLPKLLAYGEQGFTNVVSSADGVVRRLRPANGAYPSFALAIADAFKPLNDGWLANLPKIFRVNYRGPSGTFGRLSFKDVVENRIPADFVKSKIVLIGVTAVDLHDYHQTPFGLMAGVELQANAVQTILDGAIFRSSIWANILSIIILSILTVALASRLRSFAGLLFSVIGILAVYNFLAFLSFDKFFILDLFYPNLAVVIGAGISVIFQYVATRKEKKFIQDSFSRYLAPQVIDELIKDPSKLKLGGERKTVTILFSDIRGFTTISEKMQPEELTKFLNRYLSVMTEEVFKHGGLVDKYIGDAVMAFWGAPLADENHALHAILTALEMMARLSEFNKQSASLAEPVIDIGIGVNSGEVTVGNMGSDKRFDYTVIGDTVNLASRLEGLNKTYVTNIIASQATVSMLGSADIKKYGIEFREIGDVQVKGKEIPTKIYEIRTRS